MGERNQFTFYRSYYEAIKPLTKKDQAGIILAVAAYALDEQDPKGLSPAAQAAFCLIRPTLDSGRKKAESIRRKREEKSGLLRSNPEVTSHEREVEKELEIEVEIEKESLPPIVPLAGDSSPRSVCREVVELYNSLCPSLPRCRTLSEQRKKAIHARLNAGYKLDDFRRLFELAEGSAFLRGANGKDWTADIDWLIRDANMAKVLDGKYSAAYGAEPRKPARQAQNEAMTQRVQAGTAALGEHERAAIARMLREGGLDG